MNAKKSKKKAPSGAPAYHRLTEEQRIKIEALKEANFSKKAIAEAVHCHPSTVSRELVRNRKKKVGYTGRIQGFPADFILPEKRARWMKLIGNSVSVPVIQQLVDAIKETGALVNA